MENKLNIAEILKGCPSGMELDCVMYENVTLDKVSDINFLDFPIQIRIGDGNITTLTKYGEFTSSNASKCVIFPKGKTTWEGFVPPCKFKEGDIVVSKLGDIHLLRTYNSSYCAYRIRWQTKLDPHITTDVNVIRFATEEEKEKLFKAIKDNGYKWNAEKKELEKLIEPKFKVGDRVHNKNYKDYIYDILYITDKGYRAKEINADSPIIILFGSQEDNYELVPNKFDINTLKEFDKVLVRDTNDYCWHATFYSHHTGTYFYSTNGLYAQCIPYNDETKHLLGTKNDCSNFYKTWK